MNKSYLIKLLDGSYTKVKANFRPKDLKNYQEVVEIPDELSNEDTRWLEIYDVDDGEGNLVPTVLVNQVQKDIELQLDADKELAQANAQIKETKIQKEINRFHFALRVKAEIAVLNNEKAWSKAQTKAYLKNPKIQELSSILSSGALGTAKDSILLADLGEFYTAQEKQYILDLVQEYLDNE